MAVSLPVAPRAPKLRLEPNGPRRNTSPNGGSDGGDAALDLEWLADLLRFPIGALRRHKVLALSSFLTLFAAAILATVLAPRTYQVQSRILARRNMVLPALGNPRRTVPTESDAPARLAVEAVMSRASLSGIIDSTNLTALIPKLVSFPRLAYEDVRARVKGERTEVERRELLIGLLEKRMYVAAADDKEGIVTIGIRWRDQASALAIVQFAQAGFLASRYAQEVELLNESIDILQRYVQTANESIATSMASLRSLPGVRVTESDALELAATSRSEARSRAANGEMARLQAQLTTARNTLAQQEASNAQRVTTAQTRLAEAESRFGSAHPEVAAARTALESATQQSTSLVTLRREEASLVDQLAGLGAAMPGTPDAGAELAMQRLNFERLMRSRADSLEDPRVTYARSQLKLAISTYEDMLERQEAARIELETARAAFKYRYTVATPPEFPKRPASPSVPLLLIGGLILAMGAAVFSASARDVLSGRIVERWQIQRQLGLPLLGEVQRG